MEFVAWSSHKYVMHGFGWAWHRDHHEPHDGFLERNDLYAVVGAAISISGFMWGSPLIVGAHAWWPANLDRRGRADLRDHLYADP
jgi:beta-carotene 3-hydroxylase